MARSVLSSAVSFAAPPASSIVPERWSRLVGGAFVAVLPPLLAEAE
jgi:hypothetical protein